MFRIKVIKIQSDYKDYEKNFKQKRSIVSYKVAIVFFIKNIVSITFGGN